MSNSVLLDRRPTTTTAAGTLADLAVADDPTPLPIALIAAALCLAVGIVHIQDQGGFFGDVSPQWMKIGYYAVEVAAAVTIPFIVRQKLFGWVLGALVSIGPFLGYIASRTVGVPGDPGDVGNWGYTLGTVSLVIEGVLFLLSVAVCGRAVVRRRAELGATGTSV